MERTGLQERLLRIATSRWTERCCFALIVAASVTRDPRWWIVAGAAVAAVIGVFVGCAVRPMRESWRASRNFPHTPEYEAYARRREAEAAGRMATEGDPHRIEWQARERHGN